MNAIDTNIWLYSHDSTDAKKQLVAQQLILTTRSLALPWQVGCEFIAGSRKLQPQGFTEARAWAALAKMRKMANRILLPRAKLWDDALALQGRYSLSFWDALLIVSCLLGKVQVLYTEDMGAPRVIDSLSLINPFLTP